MAEVKKTTKTSTTATAKKTTAPKTTKAEGTTKRTTKTTGTTTAKKTTKTTTTKAAVAKKVEEVKVEAPVVEVKAEVKKAPKKAAGPMLKITLVKSASGRLIKQKRTLEALGLTKINSETVKPDNAQTRGMIFVVKHLVKVESVKEN